MQEIEMHLNAIPFVKDDFNVSQKSQLYKF